MTGNWRIRLVPPFKATAAFAFTFFIEAQVSVALTRAVAPSEGPALAVFGNHSVALDEDAVGRTGGERSHHEWQQQQKPQQQQPWRRERQKLPLRRNSSGHVSLSEETTENENPQLVVAAAALAAAALTARRHEATEMAQTVLDVTTGMEGGLNIPSRDNVEAEEMGSDLQEHSNGSATKATGAGVVVHRKPRRSPLIDFRPELATGLEDPTFASGHVAGSKLPWATATTSPTEDDSYGNPEEEPEPDALESLVTIIALITLTIGMMCALTVESAMQTPAVPESGSDAPPQGRNVTSFSRKVDSIFTACDADKNGHISIKEFQWLARLTSEEDAKRVTKEWFGDLCWPLAADPQQGLNRWEFRQSYLLLGADVDADYDTIQRATASRTDPIFGDGEGDGSRRHASVSEDTHGCSALDDVLPKTPPTDSSRCNDNAGGSDNDKDSNCSNGTSNTSFAVGTAACGCVLPGGSPSARCPSCRDGFEKCMPAG